MPTIVIIPFSEVSKFIITQGHSPENIYLYAIHFYNFIIDSE